MRMETFIRKGLRLKAHRVIEITEDGTGEELVVYLDRRQHRRLQCGECRRAAARINSPSLKAYLLKEDLRPSWSHRYTAWAGVHLLQWLWRPRHSRLELLQRSARMLRAHLDGVLVWTKLRVSNGALEDINNKVKIISHRPYRSRTTTTYIANVYHCCAALPLP
jgi:Transposase